MVALLSVENLNIQFDTPEGTVQAAKNVSFEVHPGECLGIVGESGSGKSQIFLSLMGLLAKNGHVSGQVLFNGQPLLGIKKEALNRLRGAELSMIFQDPMTSLNPYLKISIQMTEVLEAHLGLKPAEAKQRCLELMTRVGIPEVEKRFELYPYQLSGGMRQRIMIAIALLCQPKLIIADEPTTALDVTIQAQILEILADLKDTHNTAIVMITHNLGVVAGLCDRMLVLYGGQVIEEGPIEDLFYKPLHPYTKGLLDSSPKFQTEQQEMQTIPGQPPNLLSLGDFCPFLERCAYAAEDCKKQRPTLQPSGEQRQIACWVNPFSNST